MSIGRIAADSVEENEEAKHLFQNFPIKSDQTHLWKLFVLYKK